LGGAGSPAFRPVWAAGPFGFDFPRCSRTRLSAARANRASVPCLKFPLSFPTGLAWRAGRAQRREGRDFGGRGACSEEKPVGERGATALPSASPDPPGPSLLAAIPAPGIFSPGPHPGRPLSGLIPFNGLAGAGGLSGIVFPASESRPLALRLNLTPCTVPSQLPRRLGNGRRLLWYACPGRGIR